MLSPRLSDSKPEPLSVDLAGHTFIPLVEGALFWPAQRTLIVSDLHLEKGASYARNGQYLPPYDTQSTLAIVSRLMRDLPVETVISLGDSFHTPKAAELLGDDSCASIRNMTRQCDWVWIEGNHDPVPPQHLGGRALHELRRGRLIFRHEPKGETGEIAGHLHPCARLEGRSGKKVRRRCFVTNGSALILPAMGAFTGGLNVLDPAYQSVLGAQRQVFMLGEARVYAVPTARLTPDRATGPVWRF